MITFIVSILLLILGYFTYGKYIEKLFGVKEERSTPAYVNQDGVDYLPMSTGKNSLIQLLNIAGSDRSSGRSWEPYTVRLPFCGLYLAAYSPEPCMTI